MTPAQYSILVSMYEGRVLCSRLRGNTRSSRVAGTMIHVKPPTLDTLTANDWVYADPSHPGLGIGYRITEKGIKAMQEHEGQYGIDIS